MSDRELDAWISLHLFNWKWFLLDGKRFLGQPEMTRELAKGDEPIWEGDNIFVFNYTSDLPLAFQVVERMRERRIWIDILPRSFGYRIVCVDSNKSQMDGATAATLDDVPKKICLAAKQALEKTQ